ncbi:hypothetical protein CHGG_09803 [Chaetomium globosum CBS 148.51]|uniref:Major facilitator superfamily (MFS) profile domain-containing protein n=1 Tax=Chaetomium globosum (strain ATCC 6205 / CBS 148.51 / DSM 1962 / NBRC 6347 / NRRL 1970) TaxID=306901 RepID=Q2GQF1_CHAGB|nr:uncharacterized protein CHGG_09803 [Chaetomium globosum CBS 148.51]EAQ83399.1 hypothetical protein CHGG_09803 [Chaetomium globosum CBS 148.51]
MAQPSAVVESFQHSLSVNTENEYNVGQSEDENTPNENTESQARNGDSCLPPVDRGKDAWLFLAACYVIEAVTSGNHVSGDAIRAYHMPPVPSLGPMVHACRTLPGVSVSGGQLILQQRASAHRGPGSALRRRWALLDSLGFRTALRISAGILFACSAPLAFYVKPRLPYFANPHNVKKPFDMRFVMPRRFVLHQTSNVVEATGYFLPGIYLPTYARETFGTSTFMSALTLMLINISATAGLAIMGSMTDRLYVTTCMIISAVGASVSVLVVWGLAKSLPVLYVFCVLYGISAGSWASTWPGIMKEVSQNSEEEGYGHIDPGMVQGHLCVGRGVGNVISGPLSNALIRGMPWKGQVMGGYGTGYGVLIAYTGLTAVLSGMTFLWRLLGLR